MDEVKNQLRIHKFVANDPVNVVGYEILNFNKHLILWINSLAKSKKINIDI